MDRKNPFSRTQRHNKNKMTEDLATTKHHFLGKHNICLLKLIDKYICPFGVPRLALIVCPQGPVSPVKPGTVCLQNTRLKWSLSTGDIFVCRWVCERCFYQGWHFICENWTWLSRTKSMIGKGNIGRKIRPLTKIMTFYRAKMSLISHTGASHGASQIRLNCLTSVSYSSFMVTKKTPR